MYRRQSKRERQRGQMIMLFALALTAIILVVGLVVDGGYALVQRRNAQNAADFAALAGARIVAEKVGGDSTNGTDANVKAAIVNSLLVNKATPITFGSPDGPQYVNSSWGGGRLGRRRRRDPDGCRRRHDEGEHGLEAVLPWHHRRIELEGVRGGHGEGRIFRGWTSRGGLSRRHRTGVLRRPSAVLRTSQHHRGRSLLPGAPHARQPERPGWIRVAQVRLRGLRPRTGDPMAVARTPSRSFSPRSGPRPIAMDAAPQVGLPGSPDKIGSLPGNKASADCDYYITNNIVVTVPVWDYAGGNGSGGWYHIVGFTGFQITACHGGKDVEGVWRVPFYVGPTTTTPGFAGAPLAVQLVQ